MHDSSSKAWGSWCLQAAWGALWCECRNLKRERHDHKLASEQLQRRVQAAQTLQAECSRWQAAAAEAAAAAAAADHQRAEAAAECERWRRAAGDAAAHAQRCGVEVEELEEEVERWRGEAEGAGAAAVAEMEDRVAEAEEEWEREVEELRQEVARWRRAAEESERSAEEAAGESCAKERKAEACAERVRQEVRFWLHCCRCCAFARESPRGSLG